MPWELFGFVQRITSNGIFYPFLLLKLFSEFCVVNKEIYIATFRILFYEFLIIILKIVFTCINKYQVKQHLGKFTLR